MRTLAIVAAALLLASSDVHADDSKKDSVSVLPWTQASLIFTSEAKSAALEYSQLFGGAWMFYGKASAPLDEDTRVAAFTSENELAKGFAASVQFGIDERAGELAKLDELMRKVESGVESLRSGRL